MTEDRPKVAGAERLGSDNILQGLRFKKLTSSEPCHGRPIRDSNDDHNVENARRQERDDCDDQEKRRNRQHDLNRAGRNDIHNSAVISRKCSNDHADQDVDGNRHESHGQRNPRAVYNAAGNVAPNVIGSQEMLCRRRPKYAGQAYLIRRISDRRKLRPVALLEVHRGEVFKGNILKRRLPTRNTEPRGVIFQNGKINLTSITHHERFVIRYEISGSRKYEQQENDNQTGCGDTIVAELA